MTDERTSNTAMLASAVARLQAVDAYERLLRAVFNHHEPLGWMLHSPIHASDAVRERMVPATTAAGLVEQEALAALESRSLVAALVLGYSREGPDWCDLTTLVDGVDGVRLHPTAQRMALPVCLSEEDARAMLRWLVSLTLPGSDRAAIVGAYNGRAWIQVRGMASDAARDLGRPSSPGAIGRAGGIVVRDSRDAMVAESWLPRAVMKVDNPGRR